MTVSRRPERTPWNTYGHYAFCGAVTLAVLLMAIPVSTALAAGIASISLLLFGSTVLILAILLASATNVPRAVTAATLCVALFGALIPQFAWIRTAQNVGAALKFDPISYVTFSGDTTIASTRTLSYKSAGTQELELAFYASRQDGPRPTVVLLHGGGWRYGSHLETGDWPRLLVEAGFSVASVQYRLSSDTYHSWQDAPADIHDALVYLQQHASQLNIDTEHLTLFGQSAGGHLALLEAYRYQTVRSAVALYAPIDLALDYRTSRDKSAELDFIGGPPGQYADRYRALSPSTYVTPRTPRTLLVQGKSDDMVTPENAHRLAELLGDHGVEHTLLLLPLTGHSFENQRGGFATQIATQQVLSFLRH